jgi:hypothetical protein
VLCESAPGPGAVKASGSASERPVIKGSNDVAVDRPVSSGLSFPLRGYSDEEYRTRYRALIMRVFIDGTSLAPPKYAYGLVFER